jgi:hypothetical protein
MAPSTLLPAQCRPSHSHIRKVSRSCGPVEPPRGRNPVLALPAVRAFQAYPEVRALLAALLFDLQRDARQRASKSWKARKAFAAAYWSTVGIYSGHAARALLSGSHRLARRKAFVVQQPGYHDLTAQDWQEASSLYCDRRDASGLGRSEYPQGRILLAGIAVGQISYNGRIWPLCEWRPGLEPIYDNRSADRG